MTVRPTPERLAKIRAKCAGVLTSTDDEKLMLAEIDALQGTHDDYWTVRADRDRLHALLNTPEVENFDKAVPLEAAHQVERWGTAHDSGKQPEDWFWVIGYLAGKALSALKAGDVEKAEHHCISTAAVLRNWHAHIRSGATVMRPGIDGEAALRAVPQGDDPSSLADDSAAAGEPPVEAQVIDLMAALKESLARGAPEGGPT